jgi:dTDP-4-amino-4,6-dideoxygalactose transaminase
MAPSAPAVTRHPQLGVWPPLPLNVYRRTAGALPYPLGEDNCRLYGLGRHALWHGVRRLGLGSGDGILVPAYHHGSEVEALTRAGLDCRFYEGSELLSPDEAELESLVGDRTRALLLIHYIGFPQDAARWRSWCDDHGIVLIEDAAQAFLATHDGRPVGSFGELSIFCLYKTFGVPDGGAAVGVAEDSNNDRQRRPVGVRGLARVHTSWLMTRSGRLSQVRTRFERAYDPAEDFALGDPGSGPSRATLRLLPRIADSRAARARRENYANLLAELEELVPPPFATVQPGASPFLLPIRTSDKPGLLSWLRRQGIAALDFWSVPHPSLPTERFPRASSLRKSIVGLPVHQELRPRDLDRITTAVAARPD